MAGVYQAICRERFPAWICKNLYSQRETPSCRPICRLAALNPLEMQPAFLRDCTHAGARKKCGLRRIFCLCLLNQQAKNLFHDAVHREAEFFK